MKVVDLGECRDLLRRWDEVRALILSGQVKAFGLTVMGPTGEESMYFAGHYARDPKAAVQAAMRMSWELTKAAGQPVEPPLPLASFLNSKH